MPDSWGNSWLLGSYLILRYRELFLFYWSICTDKPIPTNGSALKEVQFSFHLCERTSPVFPWKRDLSVGRTGVVDTNTLSAKVLTSKRGKTERLSTQDLLDF